MYNVNDYVHVRDVHVCTCTCTSRDVHVHVRDVLDLASYGEHKGRTKRFFEDLEYLVRGNT